MSLIISSGMGAFSKELAAYWTSKSEIPIRSLKTQGFRGNAKPYTVGTYIYDAAQVSRNDLCLIVTIRDRRHAEKNKYLPMTFSLKAYRVLVNIKIFNQVRYM